MPGPATSQPRLDAGADAGCAAATNDQPGSPPTEPDGIGVFAYVSGIRADSVSVNLHLALCSFAGRRIAGHKQIHLAVDSSNLADHHVKFSVKLSNLPRVVVHV
jgi:hypothetical protein